MVLQTNAHVAQDKHLAHLKILDNMLGSFQQKPAPQEPTTVPETNIDEDE